MILHTLGESRHTADEQRALICKDWGFNALWLVLKE